MVKWLKAPRFSFFRIFASSHLRIFSLCFSCLHGYFFHHKGLEVHFLRQLKRCHYGSTQPKCCVYHCSFLYMAGRPSPACNCSKVCHLLYPGRCLWAKLNCPYRANPRIFVSSFPRVVSSWFLFTKSVNLFKANFFFSQLPDPIYRSPFTSSFQLPASFTVYCSLFTVHCSLFTVHCSLPSSFQL